MENICAILRKRNPKRLFARQRAKENASGISCRPRGRIVRVPTKKKKNKTRTHCDGYRTGDQALIGRAGRKRVGFSREYRGVKGGALEDARASVGSSTCALHERTRERAREDREREKNKIKKEKTKKRRKEENTRACTLGFSPLEYTRATKPASSLFPTSFLESLLAKFAIFPTPAGCPVAAALLSSPPFFFSFSFSLSLHHAPPALLYAASIVVPPFSTRNLLLTKGRLDGRGEDRATGKSRVLSISVLSTRGSARITPQLPRFTLPSFLPSSPSFFSFPFIIRSSILLSFFFIFFVTTSRKTSGQPRRMQGRTRRTEKVAETRSRDSSFRIIFLLIRGSGDRSFKIPIDFLVQLPAQFKISPLKFFIASVTYQCSDLFLHVLSSCKKIFNSVQPIRHKFCKKKISTP